MTVYVDILIIQNIIIDYFLIKLCAKICGCEYKFLRLTVSSVLGGLFSLYIFLPKQPFYIEIPVHIFMSASLIFTAIGYKNIKQFVRLTLLLFAVTYLLGGLLLGISLFYKTENVTINNSVIYIKLSPIILIASSVIFYISVLLLRKIVSKNNSFAEKCIVTILADNTSLTLNGIIDTGNSLCDCFESREVIIISEQIGKKLTDSLQNSIERRYRAIPCKTISGTALLDGYRVEGATITSGKSTNSIKAPIIAISKTPLDIECDAIINPRSII